MNEFGLYLLKSGIGIIVSYGFYWLLLKQETFFVLNRFYLLAALLISFIFPLISLPVDMPVQNYLSTNLPDLVVAKSASAIADDRTMDFWDIAQLVYLSGALFFLVRFLWQVIQIVVKYHKLPKTFYKGFVTILMEEGKSPGSFFHILFLTAQDLSSHHIDTMVAHERYHKSQFHSLDRLLMEMLVIVQWFNPFIWCYKSTLLAQHEYAADRNMIRRGEDKLQYQHLLFEKVAGISVNNFMSYFNNSLLKTRIKMMNKNESGRWANVKYLFALSLLMLLSVGLFPNQHVFAQQGGESHGQVDEMPVYPGGQGAMYEFFRKTVKYPKSSKYSKTEGEIFVSFVVDQNGDVTNVEISEDQYKQNVTSAIVVVGYLNQNETFQATKKDMQSLEDEVKSVVRKLDRFTPGKKDGKNVDVKITIPFRFRIG
ncbi:M56 family metallopeptidase [Fulvivirgaceae bacterium BMA12]|uniref:M56 family metallopeptidase n=1 Tax=Agaribacillus aureus TaxID=3051825 RepID=A0ABT8L8C7_9BACT|nr:M56 family metallopeptidase [Fulvivirgaceae bacterium BMA12]